MAKLFIVERGEDRLFTLPDGSRVDGVALPAGAMWRCECHDGRGWEIRLPGEDHWPTGDVWPNHWCTLLGDDQGRPWNVTGEAPNLTVTPSIWCSPNAGAERGEWHGFITNGEIVGA